AGGGAGGRAAPRAVGGRRCLSTTTSRSGSSTRSRRRRPTGARAATTRSRRASATWSWSRSRLRTGSATGTGRAGRPGTVADQALSSTGATAITGNVAVGGSGVLVGFPTGTITGARHLADAKAAEVAAAATAMGTALESQTCDSDRTGQALAGQVLAGNTVYCYTDTATLDGVLQLDAAGDAGAVWVLQLDGALRIGDGAQVALVNGAQACNV